MISRHLSISLTVATLAALLAVTRADAVPEGFGASTPGGAGNPIVHVTNLNDSGPGSLRAALSAGNRTIVFDVAGDIVLTEPLTVRAFVTIDGLSAPEPGITLRNRGLLIRGSRGAHDVIVRGLRIRDAVGDGITIAGGTYNVLIEHVSVAGSSDGNVDITEDSHDVTIAWSVIAGPGKNMLIKYGASRVTLHHNAFVHGSGRNPQARMNDTTKATATDTTLDMRNNIVANWASSGTVVWYGPWANVVDNFYSHSDDALEVIAARAYVAGNVSGDGQDLNGCGTEPAPFPAPFVETADACTAALLVLEQVAVRPLDGVDLAALAAVNLTGCTP